MQDSLDARKLTIRLHPRAQELLFGHYRTLRRIFYDVLGHFEMDYISMALLNIEGELLFLSSRPSLESNLIEHQLWQTDPCLQMGFFLQSHAQLWNNIYCEKACEALYYYKLAVPEFSLGISIPAIFEKYKVTYSFALKSENQRVQDKLINNTAILVSIGRFCLQKIIESIPLPNCSSQKKSFLRLVVNNEAVNEIST